jgi:hypothetical protein
VTAHPSPTRPGAPADLAARAAERRAAIWVWTFVLSEFACQVGLLINALGSARVVMRSAAFGLSLVLLLLVPGGERRHPSRAWLIAALAIVALSIFHPTTNSLVAGFAQCMLYVAVAAPVLWTSRLRLSEATFRQVLLALWAFHTASAGLGVLQMHYPGRFQPNVSTAIQGMGVMADAYKIRLANGETVWRAMGLTDTPGGAASAGLYAVVFALAVFLHSRQGPLRILSLGGAGIGLFCLYIGQVRSLLVMAGICSAALIGVLAYRGDLKRVVGLALVLPPLVLATLVWATCIGGEQTVNRLRTLVEDRPDEVYAHNRGNFLAQTVYELMPQYPLGAGLGRWGMMRNYFGDETNPDSPMIWVEIQWTGWLLDGGVPLVIVYATAVGLACRISLRIALSRRPGRIPLWGALLFALNVATIAVTFNYPLFISQGGMEFWFLNGCLFAATLTTDQKVRRPALREKGAGSAAPQATPATSPSRLEPAPVPAP